MPSTRRTDARPKDPSRRLHALLDGEWEWQLREFPPLATLVGDPRYNDRWSDMSLDAVERRRAHCRDLLRRLAGLERRRLDNVDRLNFDLFRREVEMEVEGQRFDEELMPLTHMNGLHIEIPDLAQLAPRATAADLEAAAARLRAVPLLVDQTIALMRRGLERQLTPPRVTLRPLPEILGNQVTSDPEQSPLARILLDGTPGAPAGKGGQAARRQILGAIGDAVVPAFRRLAQFVTDEYIPGARPTTGLKDLPDGVERYRHRIRVMTTSDLDPGDIHELGLKEVARIRREMETTRERAGFAGSLTEFFDHLRTDARFFFTDKEALLVTYRDIAKRLDPELPRLFRTLPRLPYGVIPVPAYSETIQTTAYYYPGSLEAGRPGYFFANTYDLKSRPKWEMEALVLHEAVPGHHLQISLSQEIENLPKFRRYGGNNAYIEGWALYAESLGSDLGLYRDPYAKFGQLIYEMWRAIRLVVDTGLHARGWSRDRAIAYFEENAGKAGHDIRVEVDRYISWPAQALAYKIGELKIKELRAGAARSLGDRFDVRDFHDLVLGDGPLPLSFLEARVGAWVAAHSRNSPRARITRRARLTSRARAAVRARSAARPRTTSRR